jgi:hypothetical protein
MSPRADGVYEGGNRVLDALPLSERGAIAKHVRVERFASGDVVQQPDGDHAFIDFPIDAVLSVVAPLLHGGMSKAAMKLQDEGIITQRRVWRR